MMNWATRISKGRLYLIAIVSVTILIAINQYTVQTMLNLLEDYNVRIDDSIQQRNLFLEIDKAASNVSRGKSRLSELKKKNEDWKTNWDSYLGRYTDMEGYTSIEIEQMQELKLMQRAIYTQIKEVESVNDIDEIISDINASMLLIMQVFDTIIEGLDEKSRKEISNFQRLEIFLALLSILILWLEYECIFRPIIKDRIAREKRLRILNASKDQILAVVAHDIRSPLFAMTGTLELLQLQSEQLSDEQQQMIGMALESGQKAESMIQELLDVTRMDNEAFKLEMEKVDLKEILKEEVLEFRKRAEEKKIELELELPDNPMPVKVDKLRFSRVIDNLLSNAIKFTNENGKVEVVAVEKGSEEILITIKDSGIGIPKELQGQVFEKFSNAGREGTKGEASTGLGMYIVKTLVKKHGGKIWVSSKEGVGTKYHLTIPRESSSN